MVYFKMVCFILSHTKTDVLYHWELKKQLSETRKAQLKSLQWFLTFCLKESTLSSRKLVCLAGRCELMHQHSKPLGIPVYPNRKLCPHCRASLKAAFIHQLSFFNDIRKAEWCFSITLWCAICFLSRTKFTSHCYDFAFNNIFEQMTVLTPKIYLM